MHLWQFFGSVDHRRVVAAIRQAEERTGGEIRVYVSHHRPRDGVLTLAQREFVRLGLDQTPDRNAVLILLAPRTRELAVWGDQAVHEKCGDDLWRQVAAAMAAQLREKRFTEALVTGVELVGGVLATHFPPVPGRKHALPDDVIER